MRSGRPIGDPAENKGCLVRLMGFGTARTRRGSHKRRAGNLAGDSDREGGASVNEIAGVQIL